jgi:hypothetical protein
MNLGDLPGGEQDALTTLRPSDDATEAEVALYVRYVRALALLAECAPYVDEPDYVELIETVMNDAQEAYPLTVSRNGSMWEIAPRDAAQRAEE